MEWFFKLQFCRQCPDDLFPAIRYYNYLLLYRKLYESKYRQAVLCKTNSFKNIRRRETLYISRVFPKETFTLTTTLTIKKQQEKEKEQQQQQQKVKRTETK